MTINELKAILQKEKVDAGDYDILAKRYLKNYDGFIIDKADSGAFRLYYVERAQYDLLLETASEDEICAAFLRTMSESYPILLKYSS